MMSKSRAFIKASTLGNSDRRYQGTYNGRTRDLEAVPGTLFPQSFLRRRADYKEYVALTFLGIIYAHVSKNMVAA